MEKSIVMCVILSYVGADMEVTPTITHLLLQGIMIK